MSSDDDQQINYTSSAQGVAVSPVHGLSEFMADGLLVDP
jgi:hypothetical protein